MYDVKVHRSEANIIIDILKGDELLAKVTLVFEERVFPIKFGLFKIISFSGKSLLLEKNGLSIMTRSFSTEAQYLLAGVIKNELNIVDFIRISEIENMEHLITGMECNYSVYKPNKTNLVNYVVNLKSGFKEYFEGLKSNNRKVLAKESRRLYDFFDGEVEILNFRYEDQIPQFVKDCTEIYDQSWKEGKVENVQFVNLPKYAQDKEWLGYVMYAKNEPIAYLHGLINDKLYIMIANGYKSVYRSYAPGKVLMLKILELSNTERHNIFDFGSGMSDYKKIFSNECYQIYSANIAKKISKFGIIFLARSYLDNCYFKIKSLLEKMKFEKFVRRIVRGG